MADQINPISKLYEYAQRVKLPVSIDENARGSTALAVCLRPNQPPFQCAFILGEERFGWGCGKSKKEAKTEAAEIALGSISSTRPTTSGDDNGVDDEDSLSIDANGNGNPISLLNELAQALQNDLPQYTSFATGPDHIRVYHTKVEFLQISFQVCEGRGKQESKLNAAAYVLSELNKEGLTFPTQNPASNCTERKRKLSSNTAMNPVSELNELKQSKRIKLDWEVKAVGPPHAPTFTVRWIVGGEKYPEATGKTKKEAKEEAARLALQLLEPSGRPFRDVDGVVYESNKSHIENVDTFHDSVAACVHAKYKELVASSSLQMPGRLILAGFVMSITSEGSEPEHTVISIGTGNRCIGGDKMSLRGETVYDSHAEIVARRGLVRFFIGELENGKRDIFLKSETGKCQLKPNIRFHLYISTAPCGDSAIFAPSDEGTDSQQQMTSIGEHHPKFENSKQGILRTKVEKGEGCIPVDENDNVPTYDGIIKGERLRTMSCSDKIAKWNFLGLQGSLLTQFLEPIYLSSLTLGTLYNHGHLARAVCCRFEKAVVELQLPPGYKINHPIIGRVSSNHENRETGKMKTKEYSCNWSLGDNVLEVLDGTTGRCEARVGCDSISRICKAKIFEDFKRLSSKYGSFSLVGSTYADTKQKAQQYHSVKKTVFEAIFQNKMGTWMKKPIEINQF